MTQQWFPKIFRASGAQHSKKQIHFPEIKLFNPHAYVNWSPNLSSRNLGSFSFSSNGLLYPVQWTRDKAVGDSDRDLGQLDCEQREAGNVYVVETEHWQTLDRMREIQKKYSRPKKRNTNSVVERKHLQTRAQGGWWQPRPRGGSKPVSVNTCPYQPLPSCACARTAPCCKIIPRKIGQNYNFEIIEWASPHHLPERTCCLGAKFDGWEESKVKCGELTRSVNDQTKLA